MPRRIAISIMGETLEDMIRDMIIVEQLQKHDKDHEYIIELRLDYMKDPQVSDLWALIKHNPLKKIVTMRHKDEAGSDPKAGFKGSEDARKRFYQTAVGVSAEYIDFEKAHPFEIYMGNTQLIMSAHDFYNPFNSLELLSNHQEVEADIAKFATAVYDINDCLNMLHLTDERDNTIAVPMGKEWYVPLTRILTLHHGGYLTFACLPGKQTAKGQKDAEQTAELDLRVRDLIEKKPYLGQINERALEQLYKELKT